MKQHLGLFLDFRRMHILLDIFSGTEYSWFLDRDLFKFTDAYRFLPETRLS